MATKPEEDQMHGATHKQSVHSRVTNAHHSEGHHGFGHKPHTPAVEHAHHSTGHHGFMADDSHEPDAGEE